jgi:hypothetical protein
VKKIGSLATQWEQLASEPLLRRKIAHALIAPGGITYDVLARRIVGVRPLPDFYEAFKYILLPEGWRGDGEGFWHDAYDLVPPPRRRTHYHEIVDILRASQHALASSDIATAIGCSISNTNLFLSLLFRVGYLIRVEQKTGNTKKYLYRSSGKPFKGEPMMPRKKGA